MNFCLQTMFINIFAPFCVESLSDVTVFRGDLFSLKEIIAVMVRILSVFPAGSTGAPEAVLCSSAPAAQEVLPAGCTSALPPFPVGLAVPGMTGFLRGGCSKGCAALSAVQCPAAPCAAAGRDEPATLGLLLRFPSFSLCPGQRCIFSWPVLLTAFRELPILLKSLSVKRLSLCSSFLTKWWNFEM